LGSSRRTKAETIFSRISRRSAEGFKSLAEGQKVSYDEKMGPKGKQASNIKPV
jgi:CspA family cold shock protein